MAPTTPVSCFEPVIRDINLGAGAISEQETLFDATLARLRAAGIRFDRASISLYDPARRGFIIHLLHSGDVSTLLGHGAVLPYDEAVALRRAFEDEQPFIEHHAADDNPASSINDRLSEEGFETCACVPLKVRGSVIGTFNIATKASVEYTDREIDLLSGVAITLGMAIDNQRAHEEIDRLAGRNAAAVATPNEARRPQAFDRMIGASRPFVESLESAHAVAATDLPVLITGETGTGKELLARAIHTCSDRADEAFVTVNCAALPRELVESELFGHEKGAFTGAVAKHFGRFELAEGGTILLDEIGDLPPDTQPKLLRVLQEYRFERVGGGKTIDVDVRVIAATNRDLAKAVGEGDFREDLYYRINVFPIRCPSLAERKDDISILVEHFLAKHATRLGKEIQTVSDETMKRLREHTWPGNVRELENVVQRAVVLSRGSELAVPQALLRGPSPKPAATSSLEPLEDLERRHITTVLDRTNWVIAGPKGAAAILGVHPNTLRSRMQRLGVVRPAHAIS